MKTLKLTFIAIVATLITSSCIKKPDVYDAVGQFELEKPMIAAYVEENYPGATLHTESGIWYQLIEPGNDDSYTYKFINAAGAIEAPLIFANYEGKLLDDTSFDKHESASGTKFLLDQVIEAWQRAFVPAKIGDTKTFGLTQKGLKQGSKIVIITPSIYGYRNHIMPKIPANSPLVFTIDVISISTNNSL